MLASFWVTVEGKKLYGKTWGTGKINATKNKPPLTKTNVRLKFEVEIPEALFEQPEMTIAVRLPGPVKSENGKVDIKEHVKEALEVQGIRCDVVEAQ